MAPYILDSACGDQVEGGQAKNRTIKKPCTEEPAPSVVEWADSTILHFDFACYALQAVP
jgi:hypothetical protein